MTWTERPELRTLHSRTYQDDSDPRRYILEAVSGTLHYATSTGLKPVDLTPERIEGGWRIRRNNWHLALSEDGWFGFGARQGAHWLRFKLAQVGYLHGPTMAWQPVAANPAYALANLSTTPETITLGPNAEEVQVGLTATWASIWATPGGGRLDLRWHIDAQRLKEEITINQAARTWIAANRPPSTAAAQTYFTMLFEVDWSDIPAAVLAGLKQDIEAGFNASTLPLELRDGADWMLASLPLAEVYLENNLAYRLPLQRRVWKVGETYYLGIGAQVSALAGMPSGTLVFDPTIDSQVGASADDAHENGAGTFSATSDLKWAQNDAQNAAWYACAFRRALALPVGAVIGSNSYAQFYAYGYPNTAAKAVGVIHTEAIDDAPDFSTNADVVSRSRSTASVAWRTNLNLAAWNDTPSLQTVLQEWADRAGRGSGDAVCIILVPDSGVGVTWDGVYFRSYDNNAALAPKLHVEYTATTTVTPAGIEAVTGTVEPTVTISGSPSTITPALRGVVGRAVQPTVILLGTPPPVSSQYPQADTDQSLRVFVDVLDGSGNRIGPGPVTAIASASVTRKLDGAGSFTLTAPATDERALELLTENRQVVIYAFLGGIIRELGRGTIHERDIKGGPGDTVLSVSGPDALEQLKQRNVLLNRAYNNEAIAMAVGNLASLASWSAYVDTGLGQISITFNGESALKALQTIAEAQGLHLRHESGTTLRFGVMGDDIGLRLIQRSTVPQELYGNRAIALIEDITLSSSRKTLANWLLPLGGPEDAPFDLSASTRTTPYPIQTMTGPDGSTLSYLADAASIAAYGRIERVLLFKALTQADSTPLAAQQAANMLYDAAATWLGRAAVRQDVYSVKLRKVWETTIRPGDKVRLVYRGEVTQRGVVVRYLDTDDLYWVLDVQESIGVEGHVVYLKLSNVDEREQDAVQLLIDAVELSGARQSRG